MAQFRSWNLNMDEGTSLMGGKKAPDPPGLESGRDTNQMVSSSRKENQISLHRKQEALMSRATGTIKQVGFLCFMMWMSGNQIHLFSIMMTVSGIYQPISSLFKVAEAIPPDDEGQLNLLTPRLVFCAIQLGALAFGLNKLANMGLLPTHASDYVSAMKMPMVREFASNGLHLFRQ